MPWSAQALPRVRAQLIATIADPDAALHRANNPSLSQRLEWTDAELQAAGNALGEAEMYWVTRDMTTLAIHAGSQLAEARWSSADAPSSSGLLAWAGGVGLSAFQDLTIPVDACSWSIAAESMTLGIYLSRGRLSEYADPVAAAAVRFYPPLIPLVFFDLPVTAEPVRLQTIRGPKPLIAALAAAWLMMQQPTLVEATSERADPRLRRAEARAGRAAPDVTVVELRRQYRLSQPSEPGAGHSHAYRWVVSGHWRNQPFGPERSLRRQQWIPSYTKGPDGAPLLVTERVNVWRR